ncbi:DUF1285 domain-containing protein [Lichenihabitans sp. Uapishka_5]|uniref:DUF1285 domain-containing protein n=1 Tax=Lichenihabitans sp. Uapishka_5 TaxID=3037302 RepID=UPI0029E7DC7E|nr:DUF1285 domain-containing protein [Lichenihabitans sp. Uapishka_5]MDX7950338.1 DUF1285 domain-containing protein [Lichenihabitans sp. Uapishka_5]
MAKASEAPSTSPAGLDALQGALKTARGRPPLHLWNPPFCGDIDMRIARDGTWFYAGTPIGRPALVRLFASVLRREGDAYVLVTPVEKLGITVEDAPFVGVELDTTGPVLRLRTNVDDWVTIDREHPLRFEPGAADGLKPYAMLRDGLWVLLGRPLFYELVERGEVRPLDGVATFGVASGDSFFAMAPADAIGLA